MLIRVCKLSEIFSLILEGIWRFFLVKHSAIKTKELIHLKPLVHIFVCYRLRSCMKKAKEAPHMLL